MIELEWLDEAGERHREPQVNLKLWIRLPRETALRAEKMGENLLWLGSDAERYWLFDLTSKPTTLFTAGHDEEVRAAGLPLPIRPLALLDLMALTPIPPPPPPPPPSPSPPPEGGDPAAPGTVIEPAGANAGEGGCVVRAAGAGGPMRVVLRRGGLAAGVETLAPDGTAVLSSELSEYASVVVPGISRADLPRVPTRIRITDPAGRLEVRLFLDRPQWDDPSERWDRVFDLDRLRKALRPDQESESPKGAARTPGVRTAE